MRLALGFKRGKYWGRRGSQPYLLRDESAESCLDEEESDDFIRSVGVNI
jgi:hypothetical protein